MEKMVLFDPSPAEVVPMHLPVIFTGTSPKTSTSTNFMWRMKNTMDTSGIIVFGVQKLIFMIRCPPRSAMPMEFWSTIVSHFPLINR